ncbi:DUF3857 and transglutaminase domain-containing protein, partial [bacterium]|nr:DUF3857 and transglutaminase domain-containing protein [bacterium]
IILAILALAAATASGDQWIDTNVQKLIDEAPGREEHPDASALFLKIQKTVSIEEDGSVEVQRNILTKVLTLMGRETYSNQSYIYNSDSERLELLKGVTVRSTGRTVEVDEDAVNDITPAFLEGASIYANVLQKVISFPVVGRNATMELQLIERRDPAPDGNISGVEYFAAQDPVIHKEIRLNAPRGMKITSELVPGWVGFRGDVREHDDRWEVRNVPGVTLEPYTPSTTELYPKLLYSSYKSWSEVAAFLAGQFYPHVETTGPVDDRAAAVTDGLANDEDRTREIFLDDAQNIRYIPLQLGLGGYEPNDAAAVLENLYGDTRDQAVLFVSMLRSQGIDAYPAATQALRTTLVEGVPTPEQFDKLIVALPVEGGYRFLDPRLDDVAYGHLYWGRGNMALVVLDDGTGELVRIPEFKPEDNLAQKYLSIQLNDDGSAQVRVTCQLRGFYDRQARRALKDATPLEEKKFFEGAAGVLSQGAESVQYSHSDLSNLMEAVSVRQTVMAQDFAVVQSNMIILRVPPHPYGFATIGAYPSLKERELPFDNECETRREFEAKILIPKSLQIERIPEPLSIETEYADFEFDCTWIPHSRSIFWRQTITIKELVIPADGYDEFKQAYDTLTSPKNSLILLKYAVDTLSPIQE